MKKKVKGFTLIELVVVVGIIGALTAVLVPAWMTYIQKTRLKTQNQNARVVYNAAQTVAQEYMFAERKMEPSKRYVGKTTSVTVPAEFYFYWDGSKGTLVDVDGNDISTSTAEDKKFANKINRIFTGQEDNAYKIYIKDYLVQSVACGRFDTDSYIGSYPVKQDEKAHGTTTVHGYVMSDIDL